MLMKPVDPFRELGDRPFDDEARRDLADRQRSNRRVGNAELVQPPDKLLGRACVHDATEPNPCVSRGAHGTVFSRRVDGGGCAIFRREVACRPPGDVELGVLRAVAAGDVVVVLEKDRAVCRHQHRAERIVAGGKPGLGQLDSASEVLPVSLVYHAANDTPRAAQGKEVIRPEPAARN